ncbi:hypothetical protein HBN50_03055 [Halobacteriovorax sp. GB3]|uniref:hypothetical protein n=1 Tax=Halobacteriovorax sp. GB3 TaxID=2719615 RepID=UPI0023622E5F|nr:hypothetical protein [Halobacteriovorax sp. GB3]MDD0852054.1 hypothetical protein [Halobacteriovorax sp. GB3]
MMKLIITTLISTFLCSSVFAGSSRAQARLTVYSSAHINDSSLKMKSNQNVTLLVEKKTLNVNSKNGDITIPKNSELVEIIF